MVYGKRRVSDADPWQMGGLWRTVEMCVGQPWDVNGPHGPVMSFTYMVWVGFNPKIFGGQDIWRKNERPNRRAEHFLQMVIGKRDGDGPWSKTRE